MLSGWSLGLENSGSYIDIVMGEEDPRECGMKRLVLVAVLILQIF